jgi:hypothetical protein
MVCIYVRLAHPSTAQLQAGLAAVALLMLVLIGIKSAPSGMVRGMHAFVMR